MKYFTAAVVVAISVLAAPSLMAAPSTVPSGLNPGDQYRLAFVTSGGRANTSSDIADYNSFVQDHADAVPELLSLGATWSAIASTAAVDARDNTGTNPSSGRGVPIYLLNDTFLASSNPNLWGGSLSVPLNVNEFGNESSDPGNLERVWTGSLQTGRRSFSPLGGPAATFGVSSRDDGEWITGSGLPSGGLTRLRLYGLSEVLTVVPEPSTLFLLSIAGMGVIVGHSSRARRLHRN